LHRLLLERGDLVVLTHSEPPFVFFFEQFGYRHFGSCFYDGALKRSSSPLLLLLCDARYLAFVEPPYLSDPGALEAKDAAEAQAACELVYAAFPSLANSASKRILSDKDLADYALRAFALGKVPSHAVFEGLRDEEIAYLMRCCETIEVREGALLIGQGEQAAEMFLVLEGLFEAVKNDALHLNFIWPGEIVGEIAFILGGERTAYIRALADSKALRIDAATFETLLRDNPPLSLKIMSNLAKHLAARLVALEERHFEEIEDYLELQLNEVDSDDDGEDGDA